MSVPSILFIYTSALLMGQGGVSMGIMQAPDALLYNPALVSRNLAASFSYGIPYGMRELGYFNFGVGYRGASFAGARFALNDIYHEQIFILGYRRKFVRRIDIGLGLGYHMVGVKGYDDARSVVVTGGGRYKIGPLYAGGNFLVHTKREMNFTGRAYDKFAERFNVGCSVNLPKGVSWGVEGMPGEDFRVGVNVSFTKGLSVRMGIFDKSRFTLGFGLSTDNFAFDFALVEHRELGETYISTLRFSR